MRIFGYEPAALLAALNALVAVVVSFGLPLSTDQANAVTTIATAGIGIWIALMTRPIVPTAVATLVGTVLTALAAFNLELSEEKVGSLVALTSIVLGLLIRANVSPATAVRAAHVPAGDRAPEQPHGM